MASIRRGIQRSLVSYTTSALRFGNSRSWKSSQFSSSVTSTSTCSSISTNTAKSAFSQSPRAAFPNASPFTRQCYASQIARLPGEIAVVLSLIPYYSATADSRLVSRLGTCGDAPILQDDGDGT